MKRIGRMLLILASISLLAIALTPLTSHQAAASGSTPVTVVNTPSMNIANTPVAVTNPLNAANNPIPLVVSANTQLPYQDSCTATGKACFFHAVPNGMRLVIQEVDFIGVLNSSISDIVIRTTVSGTALDHFFPVTNALNSVVTHQPTTLYADSNSTPECGIDQVFVSAPATCAFSGYLEPVL